MLHPRPFHSLKFYTLLLMNLNFVIRHIESVTAFSTCLHVEAQIQIFNIYNLGFRIGSYSSNIRCPKNSHVCKTVFDKGLYFKTVHNYKHNLLHLL